MRRTGYVYALRYLLHDPGSWHPESLARLKAIQSDLEMDSVLELLERLRPDYAPLEWVERHEDPRYCYPGTGYREEEGIGAGKGFTLNLPLPPRSGDAKYLEVLKTEALPRLRQFAPQLVFISAGFDAHEKDPLAQMRVTRQGYRDMAQLLLDLALETASGRLITVLEGGYNPEVLEECVEDHVRLLLGIPFDHF
ncbi:MAG: hypothetical protein WBQ36_09560 [Desulfobaccales bacterium]